MDIKSVDQQILEIQNHSRLYETIDEVFEYDIDSTAEELERYCKEADFVFNLAGVNRPKDASEFMQGNFGFASTLLDTLKKYGNKCPVMLSSSQQASLTGRFGNSEYGRSKKAGEDLFLEYGQETGAKVLVYRFPNLYGKWCRPNYNSAVATFCNAFANDLPYTVNDPSVELELLYIDDLIAEMIGALKGEEHRCEFNGLEVVPSEPSLRTSLPLPDGKPQILEYEVSGERIQSVIMLPGYTHNIINLSDTEDLVTVMYCNEIFDPSHPDTFGDPV